MRTITGDLSVGDYLFWSSEPDPSPATALVVCGVNNGMVRFSRLGGGIVHELSMELAMGALRLADLDDINKGFTRCLFTLGGDEDRKYEGYTDGAKWNGWERPILTAGVFRQLCADLWKDTNIEEEIAANGEAPKSMVDGCFIYDEGINAGQAYYIAQHLLWPVGVSVVGGIKLFRVGDIGLAWSKCVEEGEDSDE